MNIYFKLLFLVFFIFITGCSSLPTNYQKTPSYSVADTRHTAWGKEAEQYFSDTQGESVMQLLNEGTDAFIARLTLLKEAEHSIDVQYFIWHDDLIGKLLFNGIVDAAERGVRVRILLDDFNVDEQLESMLYALDQHKNIEVRLYNPIASRDFRLGDYITDGSRINRRMHNKSFTVDRQYTIIGGRNIGNEYFSADKQSNFKDLDVMSIGPIVNDIEKQFDIYWNSKVVYPVKAFEHNNATNTELIIVKNQLSEYATQQKSSKYALDVQDSRMYQLITTALTQTSNARVFKGKVKVVYDDPEKGLNKSEEEIVYLKSLLKPHIEKVTNSFELISPYFVPGDEGTQYLLDLVNKGIKVRVLTNSLSSTDGVMAQSGYARHRIELLEGGVELYELKTEFKTKASRSLRRGAEAESGLHAKTYIFDRKEIFIGSFNFDQRSANINTEVGVIYLIPEMAELISSGVFGDELANTTYKLELIIDREQDADGFGFEVEYKIPIWVETVDGKEIRYKTDPDTSVWRRFSEDFFSVLPIESQL